MDRETENRLCRNDAETRLNGSQNSLDISISLHTDSCLCYPEKDRGWIIVTEEDREEERHVCSDLCML